MLFSFTLHRLRPLSQVLSEHQDGLSIPYYLQQFIAIKRLAVDLDNCSGRNGVGDVAAILFKQGDGGVGDAVTAEWQRGPLSTLG